jgi:hypothetical protein
LVRDEHFRRSRQGKACRDDAANHEDRHPRNLAIPLEANHCSLPFVGFSASLLDSQSCLATNLKFVNRPLIKVAQGIMPYSLADFKIPQDMPSLPATKGHD